jgi:hypothetical protein
MTYSGNDTETTRGAFQDLITGSKKKVLKETITVPEDSQPEEGLGNTSVTNEVASKMFFRFATDDDTGRPGTFKMTTAEEYKACVLEANAVRFGEALMKLGYDAVERARASNTNKPPYPLPRLLPRVAHLGIAISSDRPRKGIRIVEEYIDNFRPLLPIQLSEPAVNLKSRDRALAELFCALQHIQYLETHGLAFVADFQGNESVLSDLKILVDPCV